MKMKWMMIGLVAVLTACGGGSGQTEEEGSAGTEQTAVVEASRPDAEAGQSRTTETVNADGSVTTETTRADGSVTTTTTSRIVKTTTLPNSGSVEMDMNTDLNVNMDAEVNVDSEVNVATEVNVGSDVDMDVDMDVDADVDMDLDMDMDVDMDMNADIDMDVESSGTADASVTISDYADFDPQNMVDIVRHGSLTSYSQRTVGDVFGEVFSHPEWTYFESEDGDDVVEFTGEALYGDEEGRTTIQFLLYEDATFGLSGIWVGRGDETIDEEYSMSDAEIDKTLNIIYGLQQ